jgi:hypothetical protein
MSPIDFAKPSVGPQLEGTLKEGKCVPIDQAAENKYLTGVFDDISKANTKCYQQEIFEICGFEFKGEEYIMPEPPAVDLKLPKKGTIVGLNTGCGGRWTSRLWPENNWIALAKRLKKAGYVPKVEYYSEEITNMVGKVKASQPEPYRNLAKGGTVLLKVGKPGYPMPDFIGKNAGGALQTIQQLNDVKKLALKGTVVPGKTTNVAQDNQKVYEQSPAAGSVLSAGSEIKLAAYKYVKPGTIIMPNLIGKTEKEAVDTLAAARLKVDVKYGPSPRQINLKNRVMQQSVSAGSETAGPILLTIGK